MLSHLGGHIDLDAEPRTRCVALVDVPEPQVRYPSRGIPDLVAGGPSALGLGAPSQQGGPHGCDGRGARRVKAELGLADRGRVGVDLVEGCDLGDPSREVNVLLGDPFDDVLCALVVAIDGIVGDEFEVDIPLANRHARVVL